MLAEVLHGTAILQEKWSVPLFSSALLENQQKFLQLGLVFSICCMMLMLYTEFRSGGNLPRVFYLMQIGIMVSAAFVLDPFRFLILWTIQHWMVSIGLVSYLGANDRKMLSEESLPILRFFELHSQWRVLILLCVLSIVMTPFMEVEALSVESSYSAQWWPEWWNWMQGQSWLPILLVIGFSSGFIHYLMDRAVFRFSNPQTRSVLTKLLDYDRNCLST